jgi:hypothetical protein
MMIIWWSKHVGVILNVLVCDIWINVLIRTSALVGPLYTVLSISDFEISPCSKYFILSLGDTAASEFYVPTFRNSLSQSVSDWFSLFLSQNFSYVNTQANSSYLHNLWRCNIQNVPKRRHIKFRAPGNCPQIMNKTLLSNLFFWEFRFSQKNS